MEFLMFKFNIFSGHTYYETETMKVSDNGNIFTKLGNLWVGNNGETVQQFGSKFWNNETGVMSSWGDPFGEEK
jgi:hypothetical protein